MPEKKGPGTDQGADASGQTSSSALGGASDRALSDERSEISARRLERQEGRSVGRDEERPREV